MYILIKIIFYVLSGLLGFLIGGNHAGRTLMHLENSKSRGILIIVVSVLWFIFALLIFNSSFERLH